MAAQSWGGKPLRFRGTPSSLSAALSVEDELPRKLPVRIAMAPDEAWKRAEEFVARAHRVEADLVMLMTLPPRTPPGTYEGKVEVDGEERDVVIEVEPEVQLDFIPEQLTLRVTPGEHAAVEITIVNASNVEVEIRKAYAFGIFALGGLERALHRAYTDKRPEGDRRIDYLGERLAEEHGGVVRIAVEKGSGTLESGETRDAVFNFHVPSNLAAGRTYSGTLPIYDERYYIRLIVGESKEPPKEPPVPRLK